MAKDPVTGVAERPPRRPPPIDASRFAQPAETTPPPRRFDTYSMMVKVLRIGLPLAAVGLLALVFLVAQRMPNNADLVFSASGVETSDKGIRLTSPHFTGRTSSDQAFSLQSEWAEPDAPDPTEIMLGPLSGELELGPDQRLSITALSGVYLPREERVRLQQQVIVRTSDGYEMTTDVLLADAADRLIWSEGPVEGHGPSGQISGGSMRATDADGGVLWLDGGVRATLVDLVESRADGR